MNTGLETEVIPTKQEAVELFGRLQNLLAIDHLFQGSLNHAISRQEKGLPWNFSKNGDVIVHHLLLFAGNKLETQPTPMTIESFIGEIEEMLASD